jgi:hypothetical protein
MTLQWYLDEVMKSRKAQIDAPQSDVIATDPEGDKWRNRVNRLKSVSGFWAQIWGPKPDETGCLAPPAILSEFGYG